MPELQKDHDSQGIPSSTPPSPPLLAIQTGTLPVPSSQHSTPPRVGTLAAPLFAIGPIDRPNTPPPRRPQDEQIRSPLGPRQSLQFVPPSPTRSRTAAIPPIALHLPSPSSPSPATDLDIAVDWDRLPPKMASYCRLFTVGKGSWGEGWSRCVEGFIDVERIDGFPVRSIALSNVCTELIASCRSNKMVLALLPRPGQTNSTPGSSTPGRSRTSASRICLGGARACGDGGLR